MSWAAHQFEYYAVQGHLPKKWLGRVSFLGIVVGDQTCDLFGKLWAYGFDIDGTHYGPDQPAQWHRGWPGLGLTHSILWAFVVAGVVYALTRSRPWTIGVLLGAAIHVMTDVGDSVGTMLAFPISTQPFSVGMWAYGVTPAGRNLDAAAYYSSMGFVMDVAWLVIALTNWRCLTLDYWRTNIVTADPRVWAWLGKRLPERALVTLYRSWFLYGACRLVAWTAWAHLVEHHEWDLSWGGPAWITKADLSNPQPMATVLVLVASAALVVVVTGWLVRSPDRLWRRP
jgi:membrane-bound metal-dependent hydrolase YbcI (DUF457 family)